MHIPFFALPLLIAVYLLTHFDILQNIAAHNIRKKSNIMGSNILTFPQVKP